VSDLFYFKQIEVFGFLPGGELTFNITGFRSGLITSKVTLLDVVISNSTGVNATLPVPVVVEAKPPSGNATLIDMTAKSPKVKYLGKEKYGLILRKSFNEVTSVDTLAYTARETGCILDHPMPTDIVFDLSIDKNQTAFNLSHVFLPSEAGVYNLFFLRCVAEKNTHSVSLVLNTDYHNPKGNYLSAGDQILPLIYFELFLVYFFAVVVWVRTIMLNRSKFCVVRAVHYVMMVPLVLKCIVLLMECLRLYIISTHGHEELWSTVSRILLASQTFTLSIVFVLVGAGWTLIKPKLDASDRQVLYAVIALKCVCIFYRIQVDVCIPGFNGWFREYVAHFFDFCVYGVAGMHAMKKSADFLM
jgi:hypothetical protein